MRVLEREAGRLEMTELERAWQEWKEARARGLVDGEFPRAEELLKERKGHVGTEAAQAS